jgi:hypothetical protein
MFARPSKKLFLKQQGVPAKRTSWISKMLLVSINEN